MDRPLVSICIPGYGRVDYVRNTINSIYNSLDVSIADFEVVLSDNDPNHELECLSRDFDYPNFHYYRTQCEGFMNSYYALSYGSGYFLKLHNSQSIFLQGALKMLIEDARISIKNRMLIFYTNGLLDRFCKSYYSNFNDFMYGLSYWSSWSNGISMLKSDFDKNNGVKLNPLFPHTSLLVAIDYLDSYCINDFALFYIQRIPKRGGHNKFEAFTVDYPSIINSCQKTNKISLACENHIIRDLMKEFLPSLVFNNYIARIEKFEAKNFGSNIKLYYPSYGRLIVFLYVLVVPFRLIYRKIRYSIKANSR